MSDFTWLCENYGLSAGDPEAIDKLIDMFAGEDDEDWCYECDDEILFCECDE